MRALNLLALTVVSGLSCLHAQDQRGVGFRAEWTVDWTRTYRTSFDDGATYGAAKSPRPMLVLCWYPALLGTEASELHHRDYLGVEPDVAALRALARAHAKYTREVLVQETMDAAEAALDGARHEQLAQLLDAPTGCFDGAEPEPGLFPILVQHSGAGSSYEDDAAHCVALARRGYVVATGAFLDGGGADLGVDGRLDSGLDMAFLAAWAAREVNGDFDRIGYLGHSLGAQAVLRDAVRHGAPPDVAVLLDSTLDYYATGVPGWTKLIDHVSVRAERLRAPMLVVAGPGATFELVDSLVASERTYATFPGLGHNEFIAQGDQRNARVIAQGAAGEELAYARAARSRYRELVEYVGAYLDAHLKNESGALERLNAGYGASELGAAIHVERAAVGERGVVLEGFDVGRAPTPREFSAWVRSGDIEGLCAAIEAAPPEIDAPIFSTNMLWGSTLYTLLRAGRVEDARRLYATALPRRPAVLSSLTFLALMAEMTDRPDDARDLLESVLVLEPQHEEALERLRSLGD
ncbi:MAG: hypothetical protein AAF682_09965 [Planctomycetota bacterium]